MAETSGEGKEIKPKKKFCTTYAGGKQNSYTDTDNFRIMWPSYTIIDSR